MSSKIRVKRQLTSRSARVKSVDLHPREPWMLTSLYDGTAYIWNTETKKVHKSLSVSDLPVRVAKFIVRKNWIVTGADDATIRVFNYNTQEKVAHFSAHRDYIRSIDVHTSRSFVLSCADDGAIKLWDWKQKWACVQVFRGHRDNVMHVTFNPKDNNQFASASLDKSVKVWQLGSPTPNFGLPHDRDVNCVAYHPGGDKPYLASGTDGGVVKIWDYQTKSCVQTILHHEKDVNTVAFHPCLPLIMSGGSDGTVRLWHSSTFKLAVSLNFSLDRVWALGCLKGSNSLAIGFDDGAMLIKLGREEPAISMDGSGKIVWARHSELQQANVKATGGQGVKDGERLTLAVKDMGSSDIYPQTISHSPNGRFVTVCGDGEFIIYTAMALRSKAYGPAQEFVWSHDSSLYAIREGSSKVKVFRNFKEQKSFKPQMGVDGIYGGHLLGVKSTSHLAFYDWETTQLVRRIEISVTQVYWSETGDLVSLVSEDSFYTLKYNPEAVTSTDSEVEDGVEDAFEVLKEITEKVSSGLWAGDCFLYTTNVNRLNYCVGGEVVTVYHLDRPMYLLSYIPKENRVYLGDKELTVTSFSLLLSVLEYQTAVMRGDFDMADNILPTIPISQRARVANFLEKQGFRSQAMSVTPDPEHKFDLALELGNMRTAHDLARQHPSRDRWKRLSNLAMSNADLDLAQECLHSAQDFGGLLLLATSAGNRELVARVAQEAGTVGHANVAFTANLLLGRCDKCLDILLETNRLPEAAFFARTYLPSQITRVLAVWKEALSVVHPRLAGSVADPVQTPNLFPMMQLALATENFLSQQAAVKPPAAARLYLHTPDNLSRNPAMEMQIAEASGIPMPAPEEPGRDVTEDEEVDGFLKAQTNTPSVPPVSTTLSKSVPRSEHRNKHLPEQQFPSPGTTTTLRFGAVDTPESDSKQVAAAAISTLSPAGASIVRMPTATTAPAEFSGSTTTTATTVPGSTTTSTVTSSANATPAAVPSQTPTATTTTSATTTTAATTAATPSSPLPSSVTATQGARVVAQKSSSVEARLLDSLEEELAADLEGVNLEDFDIDDFCLDSDDDQSLQN